MYFLVSGFHLAIIEQRVVIGTERSNLGHEVVPLLLYAGQLLSQLLQLLSRRICRDFAGVMLLQDPRSLCAMPLLVTSSVQGKCAVYCLFGMKALGMVSLELFDSRCEGRLPQQEGPPHL